jgi:hypothetical protein
MCVSEQCALNCLHARDAAGLQAIEDYEFAETVSHGHIAD